MKLARLFGIALVIALVAAAFGLPRPIQAQDELVIGYILVGPQNDKGWSQAHFEGAEYVEKMIPGVKKIVLDKLNSADRPNVTLEQVVESMVEQGAKLIFTTSDEFGPDTLKAAEKFPDVIFIHVSGDGVLKKVAPPNVGNVMGKMEYMKQVAGCAAALKTQTNSIAYLGPLINDETRRLAASVYLGARYCFEKYRGGKAADLTFEVKWIGFWFNIPGVTLDPTEETNSFFDNGADVVISGIDTTEAIVVTGQRAAEGKQVWAVPYDFMGACDVAPEVCLGVPYFHWGPAYKQIVEAVKAGTYTQSWDYVGPDWTDINNLDTSAVGFVQGPGLSDEAKANLDDFIAKAAAYATDPANEGTFFLWEGPLTYQDGTVLAEEGVKLPMIAELGKEPSVWYLEQLLQGMVGASTQQ